MKRILVTGKNSYLGDSFIESLQGNNSYEVVAVNTTNDDWIKLDFTKFDTVFHVAGIAHDTKKKKGKELYFKVNSDLAFEVAKKSKESGIKHFIFMSTILVYNGCGQQVISSSSVPCPKGAYAQSKLQAEKRIQELENHSFKISILRPPMIFGLNCKGNFATLEKFCTKFCIFPNYQNKRSMLYIGNFVNFVKLVIDNQPGGVLFPQNADYFSTKEIIEQISLIKGRKIKFFKAFNFLIKILAKKINIFRKVFGDNIYDKSMSLHFDNEYILFTNKESIENSVTRSK